tara:strand:- start:148 stop:549 length:402 start_codon:yes stop_codon:yes gene_type:complete
MRSKQSKSKKMLIIHAINNVKKYWLPTSIIIVFGITVLSLAPLEELPNTPSSDKMNHLIAYASLAYPASLRRPKGWKYMILIFALYSGLIEIIQPYTNRHSEWIDFIANLAGLAIGLMLAVLTNKHQGDLNDR